MPLADIEALQKRRLRREAAFNLRAYPDEMPFEIFDFISTTRGDLPQYSNRSVQKYIDGEILGIFLQRMTSSRDFAKLILLTAKELMRIHESDIGIIHCDIHASNIMVHKKNDKHAFIHIIDFGSSHWLGEEPHRYTGSHRKNTNIPQEMFEEAQYPLEQAGSPH